MLLRCSQFRPAAFVDRSLTSRHRDLVPVPDRVAPVGRVVVAVTHPADLHPGDRAGKLPADPAEAHLEDLPPVAPGLMDRVGLCLVDPAARVTRVDRALLVGRVIQAVPEHTSRVDPAARELTSLVDPVAPAIPAPLVVRLGKDHTDLVDRRRLEHLAGRHRRRIDPPVRTTEAVLSGVVPTTRRTASAHPTTARRHHPRSAGSAGTTGLRPAGLRRTGTGRHLQVAGMVPHPRVVGTVTGMGRRAT